MKKYALVSNNWVQYAELRETAKYLIDDEKKVKYKKVESSVDGCIASNKRYQNWSWSGHDIYDVDSDYVLEVITSIKQKYYMNSVIDLALARAKEIKSFEDAKKINELLDLGVEL